MTLQVQMAADADIFLNDEDFGENVTWQPKGVDPLEDPVAVQFHQGTMMVGGQVQAIETEGTILVAKDSIPDPSPGASFVREDGKEWTIDRSGLKGADAVFYRLSCHLDPIPTFRNR